METTSPAERALTGFWPAAEGMPGAYYGRAAGWPP